MARPRFVLATTNARKAEEIQAILGDRVELLPRPPEVPEVVEDGATLADNALLKARALCLATGLAAIADDSGIEVEALDGAPGVHSARYAGEPADDQRNVDKILAELAARPADAGRRARFRTVAAAVWPDGREVVCEGAVDGAITEARRGSGGFGYDPVFVPDEGDGRTFGEMAAQSPESKHALSHRGRAFRALALALLSPEGEATAAPHTP
jgi:XTP/dITP diphosphohydrolase